MHYNVLDRKRRNLLDGFSFLKKEGFYLAGGTGLALHIGHRKSIDFDFFREKEIDTNKLFQKLLSIFSGHSLKKIQEEKNTLSIIIDDAVKVSFFSYPYKLIEKLVEEKYFHIASIADIGCMKLSAVVSRATKKDYVDLFFILKNMDLGQLLEKAKEKMPQIDADLILKSLIYFKDIENEKLIFLRGFDVSFSKIQRFLKEQVKQYFYRFKL